MVARPYWRRKQPSERTREAVLDVLRRSGPLTACEIAAEAHKRLHSVYPTLDWLRIAGAVELVDDFKFRKVENICSRMSSE